MLVHRKVTRQHATAGTHLYIWVKTGSVKVNCLAQEHTRPIVFITNLFLGWILKGLYINCHTTFVKWLRLRLRACNTAACVTEMVAKH